MERYDGADLDPGHSILVIMNATEENFKHIFSKLEFITSMKVIEDAMKLYNIPAVFIERNFRSSRLSDYIARKYSQKMVSLMSPSSYDEEYIRQFGELAIPPGLSIGSEDIFSDNTVRNMIEGSGKTTVVLAGFYTESDIYISAIESLLHDYYTFVISDATSTISERTYFEALDLLSQHVEVIDSRDLIRYWSVG
ncbi:TVG0886521 [Thermoplasma volcanium GSS1]|uniref:TVG0886521 protein n=1 Tax=Thermoplasma volcanium (strain ATCC 51530 / DSM 4299 / JCM 9571 / NBRC 15438 / GSS1) TaxID=273116 RepID=Q97AE3_THEVO|nr:isochorismatase family protein [Thermoplasma volcanium]BAB60009.1 TVG0886521 [Thermoplasma volcanium GSS1]